MPKIAIYCSSLSRGGTERVIVNLSEYLKREGWDIVLVTIYRKQNEYPLRSDIRRVLSDITPEETCSGSGPLQRVVNFERRRRKLCGIWKTERPDLIVSFLGKNNMMAIETGRKFGIPVIAAVRGDPELEYPDGAQRSWMLRTFPFAAGIICTTEDCASFFPVGGIKEKTKVLPNPLNPAFLIPPYEGKREKRAVAVGRLDGNKNQSMMIRAFAGVLADAAKDSKEKKHSRHNAGIGQFIPDFDGWTLHIYGDGPDREKLEGEIHSLGMDGRIFLEGAVSNVAEAISRASIFLLTSDTEGLPNSLLEAMSLGLAPISTDCPVGGPRMVIRSGENGLLIPVEGIETLKSDLKRLMADPEYSAAMGKRAECVREVYAPDKALPQWEVYFREILNHEPG